MVDKLKAQEYNWLMKQVFPSVYKFRTEILANPPGVTQLWEHETVMAASWSWFASPGSFWGFWYIVA